MSKQSVTRKIVSVKPWHLTLESCSNQGEGHDGRGDPAACGSIVSCSADHPSAWTICRCLALRNLRPRRSDRLPERTRACPRRRYSRLISQPPTLLPFSHSPRLFKENRHVMGNKGEFIECHDAPRCAARRFPIALVPHRRRARPGRLWHHLSRARHQSRSAGRHQGVSPGRVRDAGQRIHGSSPHRLSR